MSKREFYLEDIPLQEALDRFFEALNNSGSSSVTNTELIPLQDCFGRITAEPIWAKISSPHYHSAAMDGIAVVAEYTYGASKTSPIVLEASTQAIWVDTGDPVPLGFNAVIMLEDLQIMRDNNIQIMAFTGDSISFKERL